MQRRQFIGTALASGAALHAPRAFSQPDMAFPTKAVRLVVGTPPGNALDVGARILADSLPEAWKHGIFVDNRPGGMGVPAVVSVKTAPADGYTILIGASSFLAINPSLVPAIPYDVYKDFQLIGGLFTVGMALVTNTKSPFTSLNDVLEFARKSKEPINIGFGGNPGTTQHIAAEMFVRRTGIQATLVPYKGSAPAMTDLIGGQIPLLMDSMASVTSQVRGGRIRALAVASAQRAPQLPDVPTFAEVGIKDFTAQAWGGVLVPAATPKGIVDKITKDVTDVLNRPEVAKRMAAAGLVVDMRSGAAWTAFVKDEAQKYGDVIRAANITPG